MTFGMKKRLVNRQVFEQLDEEFKFTLDPYCTTENQECKLGFQLDQGLDGLKLSWRGHKVFLNLLGIEDTYKFLQKAHKECLENGVTVVVYLEMEIEESSFEWFDDFIFRPDNLIKQFRFVPGSSEAVIVLSPLYPPKTDKENELGLAS